MERVRVCLLSDTSYILSGRGWRRLRGIVFQKECFVGLHEQLQEN